MRPIPNSVMSANNRRESGKSHLLYFVLLTVVLS
ncbi:hypothetical protein PHET_09800 [Paragonimus heterotremus]|uniref:Uncharacterized protein n=1 Tax=Paragonimus heterotremus TaxID=100268 RepID=A0A8J4WNJ5_9TREM|nr:hypothetical protein PHET_09800 [Paragonimus heterotremus]